MMFEFLLVLNQKLSMERKAIEFPCCKSGHLIITDNFVAPTYIFFFGAN